MTPNYLNDLNENQKEAVINTEGPSLIIAGAGAGKLSISVRDEGAGLPPGFDLNKPKVLGMRIITSFVKQLNGTLAIRARDPGTEFVVTIPR